MLQTIGERLEEARKKKGISIREAAEATKIRGDYLQKLEGNQFDLGLTPIYTKGFLRNYATFLKVPHERLLHDYAAIAGGTVRPRQVNREIYGRMDISVATAGEPSERAAPPVDGAAEPAPASAQPQRQRSRGASSLPGGPDPAVVFQYLKWGGAVAGGVLLIILLFYGVAALRTGKNVAGKPGPTDGTANNGQVAPPSDKVAVVTALDVVVVQIWEKNPNAAPNTDNAGRELLPPTTLSKGETRTIPRNGSLLIYASAQENIQIEAAGKRIIPSTFGHHGAMRIELF